MVESGDKQTQNPPSADDLARAEHYARMVEAIAREEDENDDLEMEKSEIKVQDSQEKDHEEKQFWKAAAL